MRALFVAFLIVLTALAGCLAPGDTVDPGSDGGGDALEKQRAEFLDGHPEFCDSEEDSGQDLVGPCTFWDDMYHQFVVYDLDTYEFDVVIVPPTTEDALVHIQAARQAVEAWRDGILELAEPWLAEAFRLDVYVVGEDVIPEGLQPQIVVLTGGAVDLFAGIGLEPKQFACIILGEGAETTYPTAYHHGWERRAADCTGIGFTCFAINVGGGIGNERALYDLIAHEVGHCLGAGHVGDALDFRARYAPVQDIMSYDFNPEQVGCVSNMNVRVLEGVYGHLLDRPEDMWLPRGSFYEMDPLEYTHVDCENPPDSF